MDIQNQTQQSGFNNTNQNQTSQQQQQQQGDQANQKLLSLLDKMVNPVDEVNMDLFVEGVYSFPEEWKATDEQFQFFTYQVKFLGLEVTDGKIHPRQQTEKELKEAEEAANAKKKKKDAKKDEPQLTPEEEEALRIQKEQEEEEERIRQEEWDALDEQTKFHRTQEDKYKCPQLQFAMVRESSQQEGEQQQSQQQQQQSQQQGGEEGEQQQEQEKVENIVVNENCEPNQAKVIKIGGEMALLDEKVYDEGGAWLYFSKFANLTEDEMAKTKKSKPKGLNLNDLNTVLFRAWVDLSEFQDPGCQEISQRCKLEQVIEDEENTEIPRPELQDTYIMIKIKMDPAITTLIEEIQPKISDIIPEAPPIPKQPASKLCIEEFKAEVQLAMESLALEYSQIFSKELNNNQEQKGKNIITLQKKQEIQKRKEQFIYDFNTTGKYKVLKERLKKSIVKICRDKFQKHGSITGITTDQKDQFYSELYVFLMEQTRQTLSDLIQQKREELHEDIVTSYEQTQKERDRVLQHLTKESPQQRLIRKASEYEMVNQMDLANKNFTDLLATDGRNPLANFEFCKFLLRKKQFDKAEELLTTALQFDEENQEYQFLMACLLMRRGRPREASVFLRDLTDKHPSIVIYNTAFSFLYQKYLGEQKLADKYKRITERVCLRRLGELQAKKSQKTTPNPFEIPSFKNSGIPDTKAKKGPQLKPKQWDENVYNELILYFSKYNLFELTEKAWDYIYDPTTPEMQLIQCQIYQYNEDYAKCIEILDVLLESNPQNLEVIMMKSHICYITGKLYESEDIFLKALKLKEFQKQSDRPDKVQRLLSIYLRLGNIYLKRKSGADAKAIFVRACELKSNSSLSWLGLGIACLRIGQLKEAEEALTQANIYDPFSGDTWGYLALLCLLDNGRFSQANQCLRELFKIEEACDHELLEELGDQLTRHQYYNTAEKLYLKIMELAGSGKQELGNYGTLCLKLGKVYQNEKKYSESVEMYEEAMNNLEGENERMQAEECIEQARFLAKNPDYEAV